MNKPAPYTQADFGHSPFVMFYEVTRACDLACKHCRACAQPLPHAKQLSTEMSKTLISQIASFPKPPVLVFTGGDPMKRQDIFELVHHAVEAGIQAAMTPSATPLVTLDALRKLKEAGLSRLAVSLDSEDAAVHDGFRGVPGSFARTMDILHDAREAGLSLQINTTITKRNVNQVDAMADLIGTFGIALWSVFFLVPVGRGLAEQRIEPWQYEMVFEKLWQHAQSQPFAVKTTEAHHYRRFVLQREGDPQRNAMAIPDRIQRAPIGVNDGKGVMFVSHTGSVYPSGFMPILCGKFPQESVVDVYQNSETFQAMRDPDRLKGKCGMCEFRGICGGSRARAYAITNDPLGAEPDCVYVPSALREGVACSA